jgi:hypothetical protein
MAQTGTEKKKKITEFQKFIIDFRKENCYLLPQIGNTDQTPLHFAMPTNTTIAAKGERVCAKNSDALSRLQ